MDEDVTVFKKLFFFLDLICQALSHEKTFLLSVVSRLILKRLDGTQTETGNKFHSKIWLSRTKVRGLFSASKCNLVHFTSFADPCFTVEHLEIYSRQRILMNKPKVKLRLNWRTVLPIYHISQIGLILLLLTFWRSLKCLILFSSTKCCTFILRKLIVGYRIDTSCAVWDKQYIFLLQH